MKSKNIKRIIFDNALVVIGSMLLAFGTGIFLTNLSIVSGGLAGIGIIIQNFVKDNQTVIDIFVAIASITLWLIGLIFIGKDFGMKTLLSSILYPAFLSLFVRVPIFTDIATHIAGNGDTGNILLCAIFAGVFNGVGISITFLGGGSTGGFDVILFLVEKYLHIKQSIMSFVLDGSVIVVSLFLLKDQTVNSLCGVITAFLAASIIELIYISSQSSYQADILSEKWEDISNFIQNDLERGCTIIPVKGGYRHTDKIIVRVVIDKSQYDILRDYICKTDSKAFVTFTQTKAVFGEGFRKHRKISKISKDLHKK